MGNPCCHLPYELQKICLFGLLISDIHGLTFQTTIILFHRLEFSVGREHRRTYPLSLPLWQTPSSQISRVPHARKRCCWRSSLYGNNRGERGTILKKSVRMEMLYILALFCSISLIVLLHMRQLTLLQTIFLCN